MIITLSKAVAAGSMIAVAAMVAGCGASSAGQHQRPARSASATPAAQATYVPPPPSQPPAEAAWEQNSPGYQSWIDLGRAMRRLGRDLNAGNYLALSGTGGDGWKIVGAASAALNFPSPVDRRQYKKAMGFFGLAGAALDTGNTQGAARWMHKAVSALNAWATVAQPGATGLEGCGNWNLSAESNNC